MGEPGKAALYIVATAGGLAVVNKSSNTDLETRNLLDIHVLIHGSGRLWSKFCQDDICTRFSFIP